MAKGKGCADRLLYRSTQAPDLFAGRWSQCWITPSLAWSWLLTESTLRDSISRLVPAWRLWRCGRESAIRGLLLIEASRRPRPTGLGFWGPTTGTSLAR